MSGFADGGFFFILTALIVSAGAASILWEVLSGE